MDTPLTLAPAIHIAGFIQTLACRLLTERPFKHQPDDYLLYPFNRYQACRYGLDGTLTDVRSGSSAASARRSCSSPTGWPLRPSAEGDGSAGGGGSPGEIAAQRGAADARLHRQRRFAFRAGAKTL